MWIWKGFEMASGKTGLECWISFVDLMRYDLDD
jgi:hypothetical protein